jgi:hypothetical protein
MKDTDRAFPIHDTIAGGDGTPYTFCADYGMTLPVYAAIKLRVPRSGDPEIDAMIRESRRADFMGQALPHALGRCDGYRGASEYAYVIADKMLAEWEKEISK